MVEKNKILFIGTFLNKSRGTLSPSVQVAKKISMLGWDVILTSKYENKILRLFQQLGHVLVYNGSFVHIDVFSGNAFNWAYFCGLLAAKRKKKILLTLHGGKLPEFFPVNKDKITSLFSKAYQIASPSKFITNYFNVEGFKIIYRPNPVSIDNFKFIEEIKFPEKIIWIRAFDEIYRPELAVKAFRIVLNKYPKAVLTMLGPDGGLKNTTIILAKELGVFDNIIFHEPVQNNLLPDILHANGIFINTTKYESFGMAVMEAAAAGIPIVSTPAGEIPYLWKNNEEMLITDDWSEHNMAEKIILLFENKKLAEKLRHNARLKTLEFSWENILPLWKQVLNIN